MCILTTQINPGNVGLHIKSRQENVGFQYKSRYENVFNTAESRPEKCEF
jgi:hypothetical protein